MSNRRLCNELSICSSFLRWWPENVSIMAVWESFFCCSSSSPAVELGLLIQAGIYLGTWPTLALIVLTGIVGAYLARRQGFSVLTGVVAPLWLRANAPMVVAEVCSTMKYPKRSQYKHAKQKKYHVRNWAEYNEGLRRRGDLTVWFDEEAIANWMADKTGKPGGQRVYSDLAIETSPGCPHGVQARPTAKPKAS